MRLIRKRIFRAFPELDRFSDEQCRHFVSTANSSWRRRVLRWIVLWFFGHAGVSATIFAVTVFDTALHNVTRTRHLLADVLNLVVLTTGVAIALVATMVLRDFLLRRTIRRLIRHCGTCPKCRYSLLGMRVSPAQTITCPECGLKVDVDPALGDLSTDESGTAVYKPEVARIHRTTAEARRRRHRRFFKWTGITIGSIVLFCGGTVGVWWLLLNLQANRAIAERDAVARIRELQIAMWPKGSTSDSTAEFAEYAALIKACSDLRYPRLNPSLASDTLSTGESIYFDERTLIPGFDAAANDRSMGEGSFVANREYTLATLDHARKTGLLDRLRVLPSLKAPIRDMTPPPGGSFAEFLDSYGGILPDPGYARGTCSLNAARMIDALNRGDRVEYMEAVDQSLVIAQIVERQGLLADYLVAMASRAFIFRRIGDDLSCFPDAAWVEEAITVLQHRNKHIALASALEVERILGLDAIQWHFTDPKRVAIALLGNEKEDQSNFCCSGKSDIPGSIGSYQRNKDAWNRIFASYSAAAAVPILNERSPVPVHPKDLVLVNTFDPRLDLILKYDDTHRYEYTHFLLSLASDLFRRKNGRFPTGPGDIAPLLADRSVLNDPLTGKPFRFIVRDESGKDGRPFEIRRGGDAEPATDEPDTDAAEPATTRDGSK